MNEEGLSRILSEYQKLCEPDSKRLRLTQCSEEDLERLRFFRQYMPEIMLHLQNCVSILQDLTRLDDEQLTRVLGTPEDCVKLLTPLVKKLIAFRKNPKSSQPFQP